MRIKYREASEELLRMSSPQMSGEKKTRRSVNTSIDIIEHYNIDIDKLISYDKQARKEFNEEELSGLADSIKEHGIRQPLTVIQSLKHPLKYEVVSGERRLKAAKIAGLIKVPCIILSDHNLAEEIALIENIQRQDLHPIELGEAFLKILESRPEITQCDLSKKLGISNKKISEYINFTKIMPKAKNIILNQGISNRDLLRKISKLNNPLDYLEDKNILNKSLTNSSKSILRISLINDSLSLQSNAINKLNDKNRKQFKHLLEDILKTL